MSLPPCHSRREITGETERYFCAHPRVHVRDQLVHAEICKMCAYWRERPPAVFRAFVPPAQRRAPEKCQYLGEQVGLRPCTSCSGTVRVRVFACRHPAHGETTLKDCLACADYHRRPEAEPVGSAGGGSIRLQANAG